ncbi:MAG: helix-turn-helix domain-containing protein, partial [Fimbriimonadaceae bacterium]|nr:helix-turn-helix domain-containing protein [Chitinophagales bacterium]
MLHHDSTNEIFSLAADLVNNTAQNIFLTGKAGTGKTTFLKYIREHTHKQNAVVAPTGVAAINAGGVTMHSFFQLPFEPFLPIKTFGNNPNIADKNSLFKKIMLGNIKRKVMAELELLIIDEVSMLRSDQLDCIDTILKGVRRNNYPFGGVQVLFIGDMYQLPPVAKNEEWNILKEHYASPFFFHAQVMLEFDLTYIELKKIYRQKEQKFIDILNNVRNNSVSEYDYEALHSRYFPNYHFEELGKKAITITTHNHKADNINTLELKKLSGQEFVFRGEIEREFNENALPTEQNLILKPGAQIMFIKNDTGEDRRYYNGKLATVKTIFKDEIKVVMQDDNSECMLEKETWENIRYTFNKEKNSIDEDVVGRFIQYPIRLAWAITIHKSQGLTFENVIIDAGQSFAAGQVYVALSRCTTLEGMILLSRINPHVITTDDRIVAFAQRENHLNELQEILEREKRNYLSAQLIKSFDFSKIISELEEYCVYILEKNIPEKAEAALMAGEILRKAKEHNEVAAKFRNQLEKIFQQENFSIHILEERASKGILWFAENYSKDILNPLYAHIETLKHASKVKQYLKYVRELYGYLEAHLKKLFQLRYDEIVFINDERIFENYIPQKTTASIPSTQKKQKGIKPEKGETYTITLQLFKEAKTISEIAKARNLAQSTIEGHLARYVLTGDVSIFQMMEEQKVNIIMKAFDSPQENISSVKNKLSNVFSYNEIRAVLNHMMWMR